MNMENAKLLEKVINLSKEKENKEYQEKLKKAMPFINEISKIKNELLTNEYYNKVLNEIIEKKINFEFEHNEINSSDSIINYFILKEILQNNFTKSFINSYSIERIQKIVNMLIDVKKVILYIYPIKEEMVRFFNILNLCYCNKIIDKNTTVSHLLTLNDNLHFNKKYPVCYLDVSSSKNIYVNDREYFSSFNDDEFIKYIVVSEENLQVIKEIEKQLEEKINKIVI